MSSWVGDVFWTALFAAWLYGTTCMLIQMACREVKSSRHKEMPLKSDGLLNFVSIEIKFK